MIGVCDENKQCFDCGQVDPEMASVNNGILICINCAAIHSALDDNLSRVKSTKKDIWNDDEIALMHLGGNKKLAEFFESYGLGEESNDMRLDTEASWYYRNLLHSLVHGLDFDEKEPNLHIGRSKYVPKGPGFVGMSKELLGIGAAKVKVASDHVGLTDAINEGKDFVKEKAE